MNTKINYRPEIDGLRAISVFAVIFYHSESKIFGKDFFTGGFFGVDIFFVISGYLITSLILKELALTNRFSLSNFYERRVRRIIPALLTVIIFSLPFAWIYLLPINFVDFSKSILFTLGFGSNYYFYFADIVYNAQDSLSKPFLHTWSLSVEEQYYLFFPILLLFIFKYLKKFLTFFLIIGLFASLFFAHVNAENNPSLIFYSIHSRMWELLCGSVLAYLEIKKYRSYKKGLNEVFTIIGLALIFYSFIFLNDKILHPSFISLIPIIGVSLIIWFANIKDYSTKLMSSKIFVETGLISYSLYLWHFPIFSFAKISGFTEGHLLKKLLLIILTIIVSRISYLFIEKKFRNKKIISTKKMIFSILGTSFIIVIFNFLVIKNEGFNKRLPEILREDSGLEYSWKLLKNSDGDICWKRFDDHCVFNPNGKKDVFILGDSHIGSISPNLKQRLVEENYRINILLFPGCLYIPGFDKVNTNDTVDEFCNSNNLTKIKNTLMRSEESIIILGGRLPLYLSTKYFDNQEGGIERRIRGGDFGYFRSKSNLNLKEGFKKSILDLLKNNHKIVMVYPIPEVGWHVPNKIYANWMNRIFSDNHKKIITTDYQLFKNRNKESFELLDSIIHVNLYRVFPHEIFCNNKIKGRCITHDDKFIYYSDSDHPSKISSKLINDLILKEIRKIEQ